MRKTIGINMLCVPSQMAGIGVYTFNLLQNYLSNKPSDSFEYVVFINKKLAPSFKFPENNTIVCKIKPISIFNIVHRILIEQVYLPILTRKFSLLHSVGNVAPLLCICPSLVTVHDIYQVYFPERFTFAKRLYLKIFVPLSLKLSRHIITVSNNTKKDIVKNYSRFCDEAKISITYEASRFPVFRNTEPKEKLILFVGTLEPGKNLKSLVLAFDLLPQALKDSFFVKVIGAKGWLNTDLFQLIEEKKMTKKIKFAGYTSENELIDAYRKAALFVLPSLYEGFGLPILEAMSQGCPVLISNASCFPEIAQDAALYFDPLDIKMLSELMRKILTGEIDTAALCKKGYEQCNKFSWERCAEETVLIYRNCCRTKTLW